MTVGELKKLLVEIDDELIIVMSKDAEGNDYSPLSDFWEGNYRAVTTWYGFVGLSKLTEADREAGYTDDDIMEGEKALILQPVC